MTSGKRYSTWDAVYWCQALFLLERCCDSRSLAVSSCSLPVTATATFIFKHYINNVLYDRYDTSDDEGMVIPPTRCSGDQSGVDDGATSGKKRSFSHDDDTGINADGYKVGNEGGVFPAGYMVWGAN